MFSLFSVDDVEQQEIKVENNKEREKNDGFITGKRENLNWTEVSI